MSIVRTDLIAQSVRTSEFESCRGREFLILYSRFPGAAHSSNQSMQMKSTDQWTGRCHFTCSCNMWRPWIFLRDDFKRFLTYSCPKTYMTMEYCYSGKESLLYGSWNRHIFMKGKYKADYPFRSTGVEPRREQRCCSQSCIYLKLSGIHLIK